MEFKLLTGFSEKDILEVFNLSFSDYIVPLKLTSEQLSTKMKADNVDLELSVGVVEEGQLISFILHGVNMVDGRKVLYNGGTGVIPTKRGQGLTKRMYDFIFPMIKKKKVDTLMLEVISNNVPAIKSYERVGYTKVRGLLCYRGNVKPLTISRALEIKKLTSYDWDLLTSFWDITPTAQNAIRAINKLTSDLILLGGFLNNQLVGYLIFNPKTKRLPQIAVHKNFRKNKIASTLIQRLILEQGDSITVINVDKDDEGVNAFFEYIGLELFLEQLEMKLDFSHMEF